MSTFNPSTQTFWFECPVQPDATRNREAHEVFVTRVDSISGERVQVAGIEKERVRHLANCLRKQGYTTRKRLTQGYGRYTVELKGAPKPAYFTDVDVTTGMTQHEKVEWLRSAGVKVSR